MLDRSSIGGWRDEGGGGLCVKWLDTLAMGTPQAAATSAAVVEALNVFCAEDVCL